MNSRMSSVVRSRNKYLPPLPAWNTCLQDAQRQPLVSASAITSQLKLITAYNLIVNYEFKLTNINECDSRAWLNWVFVRIANLLLV